jgi:hypothetical protein
MTASAENCRRMALLAEEAAEFVSLLSDKEELLAEARALRRRAGQLEEAARAGLAAPEASAFGLSVP